MKSYLNGFKKGIPIGLGYVAVSFAFGVMCINGGISPLTSIIISATNITSAGQYIGVQLIIRFASYFEIFLAVLLINLRYSLMSLSLTQKIDSNMNKLERFICGLFVTDEIYGIAITEENKVDFKYILGLATLPVICWIGGTALGSFGGSFLPEKLLSAMNIALYAMFIAIVVPDAKKNKNILFVSLLSLSLSFVFEYIPYIKNISLGFRVIIVTLISCEVGSIIFPIKESEEE